MSLVTVGILLILFFSLVVGGFSLLPDAALHPLPSGVASGIYTVYAYYAQFNYILPVREFLDLFLLTLAFEAAYWFWRFVRWIIGIVRGSKT